jgi:hypothetical protein
MVPVPHHISRRTIKAVHSQLVSNDLKNQALVTLAPEHMPQNDLKVRPKQDLPQPKLALIEKNKLNFMETKPVLSVLAPMISSNRTTPDSLSVSNVNNSSRHPLDQGSMTPRHPKQNRVPQSEPHSALQQSLKKLQL